MSLLLLFPGSGAEAQAGERTWFQEDWFGREWLGNEWFGDTGAVPIADRPFPTMGRTYTFRTKVRIYTYEAQ